MTTRIIEPTPSQSQRRFTHLLDQLTIAGTLGMVAALTLPWLVKIEHVSVGRHSQSDQLVQTWINGRHLGTGDGDRLTIPPAASACLCWGTAAVVVLVVASIAATRLWTRVTAAAVALVLAGIAGMISSNFDEGFATPVQYTIGMGRGLFQVAALLTTAALLVAEVPRMLVEKPTRPQSGV